jgi:hypothetical protein
MVHLTIIGLLSALTVSLSGSPSSPDTLQNISSIANIVYAGLTVAIVIVAIWSLAFTRNQMNENKTQFEATLKASAKQSQDAIDAVNRQITASETQSNAAIDAVNKQIAASESQAQEALYNQQKPVLVPAGGLGNIIETSDGKSYVVWGNQNRVIDGLRNIGVGPALNIYGILFGPPLNSLPPHARYVVWNYPPLSPGEEGDKITLEQFTNLNSETTIGGILSIFQKMLTI